VVVLLLYWLANSPAASLAVVSEWDVVLVGSICSAPGIR